MLHARAEATATTAAIDEEDCCAGTHPGQACPMRHPRPRAAASVAEGLCRLTCADPDPYASWLAGLLAWEPSSSAWVFPDDASGSGASPLFSAIAELAGPPLSPPPRLTPLLSLSLS
jgi:hypothetical protein